MRRWQAKTAPSQPELILRRSRRAITLAGFPRPTFQGVNVSDRDTTGVSSDSFSSIDDPDDAIPAIDSGGSIREGLPPAFRMRADAHYVEQLDAAPPSI